MQRMVFNEELDNICLFKVFFPDTLKKNKAVAL